MSRTGWVTRIFGFWSPYHNVEDKAKWLRARALAHDVRVVKQKYLEASREALTIFVIHPSRLRCNLADAITVTELGTLVSQELPSLNCTVVEQTHLEFVVANPGEVRSAYEQGVPASFVRKYIQTPVTRKWLQVTIAVKGSHEN